jgi:hypothetical protein
MRGEAVVEDKLMEDVLVKHLLTPLARNESKLLTRVFMAVCKALNLSRRIV